MLENAYLSIKNPKASTALKGALDPGRKLLASLRRQLLASAPAPPLDQILDPHLVLQAGCQRSPWTTAKYGQFDSPITISGSKGMRGTYPLPRGTNSFNFMQFFGKFGKIMS